MALVKHTLCYALLATPMKRASETLDGDELVDIGAGDDILVVDDHPANHTAIEAALEPLGRRLVFASSGTEALGKLLQQDFALILLDVAMPGISGIETARLIRMRERSRGTPIIFVTGLAWDDEAIDEAYDAGGFDFLTKPIRPEVLRAKVRVFLKLQERTRTLHQQAEQLRESQEQLYEAELREQRKRFESELLDSKLEQLAEADRRQHELAAIIGNELLNPLQTLQMAFDLLRDHPNADKGERIYALVEHRLVHVTRLVEGLIDVARAAAGQLQITPETVDLAQIARQAIEDCRPIIATRKLSARLDADTSITPLVMGDPVRLLQAIATLVDHAARSTPEDGLVTVTLRVAAGDVVVSVADTGRGIARALLPRIFDMFGGDATSADGGGLSVGLALVKRLVELHDGAICASSDGAGKGARFEVRLPLAPQDVELSSLDSLTPHDPDTELATLDGFGADTDLLSTDLFTQPTMRMTALDLVPEPTRDDPA